MKEVTTRDGIIVKYEKNVKGSVIGQYVLYKIFDVNDKFLGNRIGVRDLKDREYKELFDDTGTLIEDMRPTKADKRPTKSRKSETKDLKVQTEVVETQEDTNEKSASEENALMPEETQEDGEKEPDTPSQKEKKITPKDTHSSIESGLVESTITMRITFRGKQKITGEHIINYLEKKYNIWGYEITTKTKKGDKIKEKEKNVKRK